jgi:hypothetical protein
MTDVEFDCNIYEFGDTSAQGICKVNKLVGGSIVGMAVKIPFIFVKAMGNNIDVYTRIEAKEVVVSSVKEVSILDDLSEDRMFRDVAKKLMAEEVIHVEGVRVSEEKEMRAMNEELCSGEKAEEDMVEEREENRPIKKQKMDNAEDECQNMEEGVKV